MLRLYLEKTDKMRVMLACGFLKDSMDTRFIGAQLEG